MIRKQKIPLPATEVTSRIGEKWRWEPVSAIPPGSVTDYSEISHSTALLPVIM